ncbi:MAG: hypothetical protein ACRYFS_18705 [Janthinobacterium lividum]
MKKAELVAAEVISDPEMLDEYDFHGGRRGVYAERYAQGTNLVKLAPDVAAAFPTEQAVNDALRKLLETGSVAV